MPELMYVLKCFALALVVTVCMQVKIGTETIESKAEDWIRTSSISLYLQSVSGGAVLAIKNASKTASDFISKKLGHGGAQPETQKASRLNFELKRSPGAAATLKQGVQADESPANPEN